MPLLLAFNGYLTIAGLVIAGVGAVVNFFDPQGENLRDLGLGMAGVGATRKGVKKYKGL